MATDVARIRVRDVCGGRYGVLLMALLALLILAPFVDDRRFVRGVTDVLVCGVVLTGVRAASGRRRSLIVGIFLAAPVLLTHWAVSWTSSHALYVLHYSLLIALLASATIAILSAIVLDSRVTLETIKGAVCVYLLLGVTWAYLDAFIDLARPGSFRIATGVRGQRVWDVVLRANYHQMLYFSFSTLTTLGYGDIIPLSPPAQTASYLEAVAGQIYLTVLVARLVGMHISQSPAADRP